MFLLKLYELSVSLFMQKFQMEKSNITMQMNVSQRKLCKLHAKWMSNSFAKNNKKTKYFIILMLWH